MFVRVTQDPTAVELQDPENLKQFHVERPVGLPLADLARTITEAGAGAPGPGDDLFVSVSWVRERAAGRTGEGWDEAFEGMLGYAASKGWLTDDRTQIAAHVVDAEDASG